MSDSKKEVQKTKPKEEKAELPTWVAVVVAIIVIAGIIFAVKGFVFSPNTSEQTDTPLVIINNERLFESYVNKKANELGLNIENKEDKEYLINHLIDERLLIQQAKQQNLSVNSDKVTAAYDEFFISSGLTKTEFLSQLRKRDVTEQDVLDKMHNQLLIDLLVEKALVESITITDAELKELYELNKDTFKVKQAVHASHILLDNEDKVELIIKQLKEGKDFGELAQEHSIDPSAKENKGDLGFFERGMMVEEFEEAAFNANAGQIVGPVQTQFGFHIILVHESKEDQHLSLEEVREFLEEDLMDQKIQLSLQEYVKFLRNQSSIEFVN